VPDISPERPVPAGNLPDLLRLRLTRPLPGRDAQVRLAPQPRQWPEPDAVLRPAAALLLIYPHEHQWWIPLTVRVAALRTHAGQVSLPGGRLDRPDESVAAAALREANEEIGLVPAAVDVLGALTPLPIAVSGHLLHPVVGAAAGRPAFVPAPDEVERVIEMPIARLLQPDAIAWERRALASAPQGWLDVPYFDFGGARVWGATAMILAEFTALLAELAKGAALDIL
jgi:8-oxo-dGTP pyrophosphatase MutT (NUDIX family)